MKHNLLKSVILSVILLMGVSKVWAVNHTGGYIYFLKPSTWTESKVMMFVGHDSYTSVYEMEKMTNTDNLYRYTMPKWDNANYVAFANGGSVWGSGDWGSSNRTNAPHYTNVYKDYGFNSGSYYVIVPSGTGNNASITINYTGTTASSVNRTTKAISSNAAAGTVSVSGYYLSSATAVSTRSAVSSTASNTTASTTLAPASTATFKATANTGYEFVGWYDAASGGNQLSTSTTYTVKYDISFSEKTVYGRFRAKTYTVTLNASGGTGGTGSVTATYNAAMPSATMPTRNGYTFKGYYDAQSGGTQYYKADGSSARTWNKTAATTLYAQWELATYTITYDNLKGATHTNPATYTINSATITFTAPTSKPAGYTFANWSPASIATGSTGNKTVTANWTAATSTVELNQEEATEKGTASVTATYGSAMPAITKLPIRTGYTFGGYYTGKNGAGTQYYKADGTSATTWNLEGTQTLYAKWTPITYSVKFNGNGSTSGSMSNQSFTYDEAAKALTTNAFKKTGYTFAGWNTAANGSGTSYADKATVRNLTTTNNATINLYAQWTINQYTLTFGAGEGGSVTATVGGKEISSPATLDHNTSVTLTATPEGENAFAQWVNGNGVKVTTTNPYTFKLTENTTIKAEFSKPTTVYLKPSDAWKEYNAHFAIYAWGKTNSWVEMEAVDCEGDYYKANVPAGFSDFAFVRLKPAGADGYSSVNGGHNWNNKWDQTGNLSVQTNGKNMYDIDDKTVSYIHLKPNHWETEDARFVAYFFGNGEKWVNLTKNGDVYTCKKPAGGYTKVIFCRMNKDVADNTWNNTWNKTLDLDLLSNGDQCFGLNETNGWGCNGNGEGNDGKGANGEWFRVLDDSQWKTYSAPTYTVTLEPTPYGTYNVEYNGRTYKSSDKNTITIPDVPVGAIVHITDCQPYNNEYTNDFILQTNSSGDDIIEAEQEYTHTICGNTTINENFVTKNSHVVYLRVPTSLAASWNANGSTNFVYSYNDIKKGETGYVTKMAEYDIQDSKYTYYTCTIPADCHTFRFERKNSAGESALQKTVSFTHAMPFNGMNCFTITNSDDEYTGYWDILLTNGDYRLLYVEQVVEKSNASGNEWKTVVTRKKAHPSDIIKKGVESQIVSLHIYKERKYTANAGGGKTYESSSNPEIILQQYSNGVWVDKESHMVFGPLETLPGMAMAPGRRNAAADGELVYDDGIEIIKNDQHPDESNGVWNFTVTQSNNGESATIDLTKTERYDEVKDGPYYIRTDAANGNWYNYTNPDNHITRSDISKQHSNYSHYFCKWVESENNVNVKFTIANKYGYAISDTLEADATDLWGVELNDEQKMVKGQVLPKNANVRFTWNEKSNLIHRAYIAGSSEVSDRFLVLKANDNNVGIFDDKTGNNLNISGLNANEQIFVDNSNWIYHADVQMLPGAEVQVTAKYNDKIQYFVGKEGEFSNTVLQGIGSQKYLIRLLYDFKTNELISAYVPGNNSDIEAIETNLMLIRKGNEPASQLAFNTKSMDETGKTAYGVIEFPYELLTDNKLDIYKRSLYWISFPFDVNLKDAFSFGQYGVHWLIQEYDGASRAEKGLWAETDTYWKLHWDPTNIVLKAGKGYVIEIDIARICTDYATTFNKAGHSVAIYFPSKEPISSKLVQNPDAVTIDVPKHTCTIPIRDTPYGNRQIRDSHWNVIGVPSYINAGATFSNPVMPLVGDRALMYYYRWDGFDNYSPQTAQNDHTYASNFQSMFAYMVQYAGNLTWNSVVSETTPAAIAAKKNSDNIEEHHLRLELLQNGSEVDRTFVQMQEDDVTPAFDFNHDLCKITNKGLANIYSLITTETYPIEVAANVLPIQETVIPVGVVISAAGEYTFAMPDGTDGIVVELIDYETNTTTNLLLDNYTVNLGKGTFENRFALHVQPSKVTTSVEDINTNSNGVKKYLIDGILYMQKDGVLYDAQGKLVR